MTLILEIGPGSRITGFGVVWETVHGCEHVASGCIRAGNSSLYERLHVVFRSVCEVIRTHGPTALSIEQMFTARDADSALKLGQTWGAVIVVAMGEGLSAAEYTVSQIKQAVMGTGGADKQQVQMMAMHLLKLIQKPQTDASDALAIVLCHAHTQQGLVPHGLASTRRRGGRPRF